MGGCSPRGYGCRLMHITHTLPIYINNNSEILILGSFPSVKSRELGFYYSHPRNRFFSTLSKVFNEECPSSIEERKAFLKKHKIALYDVIYECDITNSSDSSIRNAVPIPIGDILIQYPSIKVIGITGKKACSLFDKYLRSQVNLEVVELPSTSPANARISNKELEDAFLQLFE